MPMSRFKPITTRFPASYFHHLPNAEPSDEQMRPGIAPRPRFFRRVRR